MLTKAEFCSSFHTLWSVWSGKEAEVARVKNHSRYFTVVQMPLTLVLISGPDSVCAWKMQMRALAVHPLVSEQVSSPCITV